MMNLISTSTPTFVLGAADPEMQAIEKLLKLHEAKIAYALEEDNRRVRADTANASQRTDILVSRPLIVVECRITNLPADIIIDHHALGDPGFGKPPKEFLTASSIGQTLMLLAKQEQTGPGVISFLDNKWCLDSKPIEQKIVRTAAADHCLGAAYKGECPGVNPRELQAWRVQERSQFQQRPIVEIEADILRAMVIIYNAPMLDIGNGVVVRDIRGLVVPELPEAAMRLGEGYISGPLNNNKYCCSGDTRQIKTFMESWAPSQSLIRIYGDPARGFAGGYMQE